MVAAAALSAPVHAQDRLRDSAADSIDFSEAPFREDRTVLPPPPKEENLIRFAAGPMRGSFKYFVDGASLTVGGDGVVRYTLVVRSDAGATNVTYEGIRCTTRERRIYAYGRADGAWTEPRGVEWKSIGGPANDEYIFVLYDDFFCPGRTGIRDAAEGLAALKRGGHPRASGDTSFRSTPLGR
ncbi:MAG: CNP1-like family protein [Burkholderiales bacterium]|nr:CNP1-like family protein [Burkholderiales bacterium]